VSGYSVYRVNPSWNVAGPGLTWDDVAHPFSPDDDLSDNQRLELRKVLTPEIRPLICDWYRLFARLGCITSAIDENGPDFILVVDGDCEFPKSEVPWSTAEQNKIERDRRNSEAIRSLKEHEEAGKVRELGLVDEIIRERALKTLKDLKESEDDDLDSPCIGRDEGQPLQSVPGAQFQTFAFVERADPKEICDALKTLAPDHELSAWGGARTPQLLRKRDETLEDWLARVAVPGDKIRLVVERLKTFGLDLSMALAYPFAAKERPEFLVEGLLPAGELWSLVGPSGAGKSTLAHQLLAALAAPDRDCEAKSFLGFDIPGKFFAALISGEEPDQYFRHRQECYVRQWPGNHIAYYATNRAELTSRLNQLRSYARRFQDGLKGAVVLDNFQVFSDGDDTKSHVADALYGMLRDFARETGLTVLVIHHTTKELIRSFAQFRRAVRGSAVHVDAPRGVLGLLGKGGDLSEFGVIASNMPTEFAALKEGESLLCKRDAGSHTLHPVASDEQTIRKSSGDDIERVAAAIGGRNRLGIAVFKSGNAGLYESRLPALTGLSRSFTHDAIDSLIDSGRVENLKTGLILTDTAGAPGVAAAKSKG
jgi:hypothetical protein